MGQREPDETEEPKGFLEEAFEHRQRRIEEPTDPVEDDVLLEDPIVDDEALPTLGAADEEIVLDAVEDADDVELIAVVDGDVVVAMPVVVEIPPEPLGPAEHALVDEALKKSGLIWVRTPTSPVGQAVWHVWLDDAIYLVTGGSEQPDPGLQSLARAIVVVRSKETTSRLVTFDAVVEPLTDESADWLTATAALAKTRLNLPAADSAAQRWAVDPAYQLYRLRPIGPLLEGPGAYTSNSHRSAPVPTAATTAGPKPKVLHRRHGSGSALS